MTGAPVTYIWRAADGRRHKHTREKYAALRPFFVFFFLLSFSFTFFLNVFSAAEV